MEAGGGDCKDKTYLTLLLCKSLGYQAEVLASSLKNGRIVEELPADQFDHVLVRVKMGNRWLYLDAVDTLSSFGSAPYWLQGLKVLSLGPQPRLVRIPEDNPEKNKIIFYESLVRTENQHLVGSFVIKITGLPGNVADDLWKEYTMHYGKKIRGADIVIKEYMPDARILEWEWGEGANERDIFYITGKIDRCRLVPVKKMEVGILTWKHTFLPVDVLKQLVWKGDTLLPLPLILEVNVSINGGEGYAHTPDGNPFALNQRKNFHSILLVFLKMKAIFL